MSLVQEETALEWPLLFICDAFHFIFISKVQKQQNISYFSFSHLNAMEPKVTLPYIRSRSIRSMF